MGRAPPGWSISSPAASRARPCRRAFCGASRSKGPGYPEWLCEECYSSVGDLAETLALLLPEGEAGEEVSLDVWMRERLLQIPALDDEEKFARLKRWVEALPADQRLAFFKLITGELRVGVSRLQVVKALAEVAGVEESRMAQRMIGYAQARRAPGAGGFRGADRRGGARRRAQALDAGRPYPFYLAQSWQRPGRRDAGDARARPSDWIVEWKFDGIRAQLIRRGERLALMVARRGADLRRLSRPRAAGARLCRERRARRRARRHGPAVEARRVPTRSTASSLSPACSSGSGARSSARRRCKELPVAFIAYDLLESEGRDIRAEPQARTAREARTPCRRGLRRGERAERARCRSGSARVVAGEDWERWPPSARRRARSAAKG